MKDEGDVLFGWENEILQIVNDPAAAGKYEIVLPSDSIVIEVRSRSSLGRRQAAPARGRERT